jgi:3-methyl-2-oxobutanoate hydroxymethyltransferase
MVNSNSPEESTSAEVPAPYGNGPVKTGLPPSDTERNSRPGGRIRTQHLQQAKDNGQKFAMLTAYEQYTAEIFDQAGIEVLLVGDSASNNVFGNETSLPVTVDELLPL